MKVVEQLSQADVDDVVPGGDSFRVTLDECWARTTEARPADALGERHLRLPPQLRPGAGLALRSSGTDDQPRARQARLYKKLVESTEGYAGEVPVIHQAVSLKAAIDALDAAFQEDRDPN